MSRVLICFLFLLFTFGCVNSGSRYKLSEKEKLSNIVLKEATQQIQKELDLVYCGTSGRMLYQIKMLGLFLIVADPLI